MGKIERDLGSFIREMRKAAGVSQMWLADKVGVSYQQIQKYEKGKSRISVSKLYKMADAFGVPVATFIEDKAEAKKEAQAARLTRDEGRVLMLYRKLPSKLHKAAFEEMLRATLKAGDARK